MCLFAYLCLCVKRENLDYFIFWTSYITRNMTPFISHYVLSLFFLKFVIFSIVWNLQIDQFICFTFLTWLNFCKKRSPILGNLGKTSRKLKAFGKLHLISICCIWLVFTASLIAFKSLLIVNPFFILVTVLYLFVVTNSYLVITFSLLVITFTVLVIIYNPLVVTNEPLVITLYL